MIDNDKMLTRHRYLLCTLFLLLFAACAPVPDAQYARSEADVAEEDAQPTFSDWREGEPEEQGMNGAQLDKMPAHIEESLSHLHSVLVVRNGVLVWEYYADGRDSDSADVVWSITKSVTSMLIGIAIDEGLIESVDQTVGDFFSSEELASSDPAMDDVTIRDLLTMTSGLDCNGDRCHNDSLRQALDRTMSEAPGEVFNYDTGASHLLAGILASATGVSPEAYAAEKLFVPIGIEPPLWQPDSSGLPFGGKGLVMRPRDLAKFGQLLLDDGEWWGEVLISAEFIAEATQNQVSSLTDEQYGYLFWIDETDDGYPAYSAVGFGGQYITVVPELELVVVITSNFSRPWRENASIIEPFIIASIAR